MTNTFPVHHVKRKQLMQGPCLRKAGNSDVLIGKRGEGKLRMVGKRRELLRAQSGVRGHRDQDRVEAASF